MKQQTAIDWLIAQYIKDDMFKKGVYEQAKQMEKEQIIDAYLVSHISMMTAEQYYRETYESKTNI